MEPEVDHIISGAEGGGLYDKHSRTQHAALLQLWDVLDGLGYVLKKKQRRYDTLEAYPVGNPALTGKEKFAYPLLNPRFEGEPDGRVRVHVWTKGGANSLGRSLENFPSTEECRYVNQEPWTHAATGLQCCGWFIMPLKFVRPGEIDFMGLKDSFRDIRTYLLTRKIGD